MSVNAAVQQRPGGGGCAGATRFVATVTRDRAGSGLDPGRLRCARPPFCFGSSAGLRRWGGVGPLEASGPTDVPQISSRDAMVPRPFEAVEQIRFAQLMGFIFCAVGVAGFVLGAPSSV